MLESRADSIAGLLSGTENKLARYMDQNQQVVVAQAKIQENRLTRNSTFLTTFTTRRCKGRKHAFIADPRNSAVHDHQAGLFPLYREEVNPAACRSASPWVLFSVLLLFSSGKRTVQSCGKNKAVLVFLTFIRLRYLILKTHEVIIQPGRSERHYWRICGETAN